MKEFFEFFTNLNNEQIMILIKALGIVAVFFILSPLFSYVIIKIFKFKYKKSKILKNAFYKPLKAFFKVLGIYLAIIYIRPTFYFSDNIMEIITKIFKITIIINTAIGLARNVDKEMITSRLKQKSEKNLGDATISFIIKVVRGIIYIIAGFMIIADLGYDLSGIITGLGLGSVVLTLAAQDTLTNLFSGVMIILDKPFHVGDYVQFDKFEGTVEDITFRSTKLRTLENSVAQVPNSVISNVTIINISRIQKRRYVINLGIVLDTDLDKLMKLQKDILKFLNENPMVSSDTENVYLREVGSSSYNIQAYCNLNVSNYDQFLKERGILNYEIMNIVHKNNIELAYDTKTIEIKKT